MAELKRRGTKEIKGREVGLGNLDQREFKDLWVTKDKRVRLDYKVERE